MLPRSKYMSVCAACDYNFVICIAEKQPDDDPRLFTQIHGDQKKQHFKYIIISLARKYISWYITIFYEEDSDTPHTSILFYNWIISFFVLLFIHQKPTNWDISGLQYTYNHQNLNPYLWTVVLILSFSGCCTVLLAYAFFLLDYRLPTRFLQTYPSYKGIDCLQDSSRHLHPVFLFQLSKLLLPASMPLRQACLGFPF